MPARVACPFRSAGMSILPPIQGNTLPPALTPLPQFLLRDPRSPVRSKHRTRYFCQPGLIRYRSGWPPNGRKLHKEHPGSWESFQKHRRTRPYCTKTYFKNQGGTTNVRGIDSQQVPTSVGVHLYIAPTKPGYDQAFGMICF